MKAKISSVDIFTHGLHGLLLGKRTSASSLRWAFFFGALPDLAPTAIFIIFRWKTFSRWLRECWAAGGMAFSDFETMPTGMLFQPSHSFMVWGGIFAAVCLWKRRWVWEMLAWPLHILIDIPTHPNGYFSIQYLWPLSAPVFPYGFNWASWQVFIPNALILAALLWWKFSKNHRRAAMVSLLMILSPSVRAEEENMRPCAENAPVKYFQWLDWDKLQKLHVKFVPQAPQDCPGPSHPLLEAAHPRAQAWVHVIEVNVRDPETGKKPWIFVDVSDKSREDNRPFYTDGTEFWDNPKWEKPSKKLKWRGYAYPVVYNGWEVRAFAGIQWGFLWKPKENQPKPLKTKPASASQWRKHVKIIQSAFPGWQFQE